MCICSEVYVYFRASELWSPELKSKTSTLDIVPPPCCEVTWCPADSRIGAPARGCGASSSSKRKSIRRCSKTYPTHPWQSSLNGFAIFLLRFGVFQTTNLGVDCPGPPTVPSDHRHPPRSIPSSGLWPDPCGSNGPTD